jgi:hypothetical protein
MRLISDPCEIPLSFLIEEKEGKKQLYVEGPFISVNVPNRNNRVYSKSLMEPIIEGFIVDKIDNKTAYGEWGHPQGPKINEERISHRIVSLKWDKDQVIGKAVVLDEGNGKIMRNIIETGGRFGMSTRGLGSVKDNGKGLQEVQSDFKLVTVDAVTDPSGVNCWINGIMEGVEWLYDATKGTYLENKIEQVADEVKKTVEVEDRKLTPEQLNEKMLHLFKYYLSELSKKSL